MVSTTLRKQIEVELKQARLARASGNEGKARVCARRAAGWAAGHYFQTRLGNEFNPSAYVLLRQLVDHESAPEELRAAARRLTTRITPEHKLPFDQDPIEDAQVIVEAFL